MIEIISTDEDDTTSDIVEWINYFGKIFARYNNLLLNDIKICLSVDKESVKSMSDSILFRKTERFEQIQNDKIRQFYKDENKNIVK